jgi:hypothetical protein
VSEMVSQAEFNRAVQHIREDIRAMGDGINRRLDVLNGQTRKHGEAIVVLQSQVIGLDAIDDTHREAIEGLSSWQVEVQGLLRSAAKVGTSEAVQEVVPSKKMLAGIGVSLATIGAGLVELARWALQQVR